tara:strand:+ start:377 stop:553 length:177 start_codon:yes stop_codon:yes gene_type:complete
MTSKKEGIVMLTSFLNQAYQQQTFLDEIIEAEIQRQESELELGSFSDAELANGSSSDD